MQVLALTDSQNPWHSFWIRFGQYIEALNYSISVCSDPKDIGQLQRGDVLVLYRYQQGWGDLSKQLHVLRGNGVRLIADVDDYLWNTPSWPKERIRPYTHALRQCDQLTCSTLALKEMLDWMFPKQRVFLIRNSAPELGHTRGNHNNQAQTSLRLCWTGAPWTRPDDLQLLRPLAKWLEKHPELPIRWLHIGHAEGMTSFAEAVGIPKNKVDTVKLTGYNNYLKALDGDIGLAPLAQNSFNQFKSEIKVLEYGAAGMAWIASDATAYRELSERLGIPMRLCNNGEDWIRNLKDLIDPIKRRNENLQLQRLCKSIQSYDEAVANWHQRLSAASDS